MSELKEIFSDLQKFIFSQGKYWMIPVLGLILILAALALFGHPLAVAPFVYTMF